MKRFIGLLLLIGPLFALAGCGSKPQPAEPPKQLIPLPKHDPIAPGGGKKGEPPLPVQPG
jgi:hypothetical protein